MSGADVDLGQRRRGSRSGVGWRAGRGELGQRGTGVRAECGKERSWRGERMGGVRNGPCWAQRGRGKGGGVGLAREKEGGPLGWVGLLASGPGEGRELGQEGRGWAGQQALGWVWISSFLFLFYFLFLKLTNMFGFKFKFGFIWVKFELS